MTPQIKQRIEQIRWGEVPEGYKKTKVGIVPEEWETTRFKNKFSRLMRKNTEGNTNVLTISAQYGLVNQEEFFNKSVASDDKTNYFLLYQGEYAYNKSYSNGYPFGAIKKLDKYEKGIVSPLYICFSANKENKCPEFYLQYFEAGGMNSEIQAFAQEGARNHGLLNISIDDFFNAILVEPSAQEQEKIAEILATQDRVIELCEKKVEQLKKLKKVFLQKMFPKPGAAVPEWRFPGFTDAWEQRKVGELLTERNDQAPMSDEYPLMAFIANEGVSPKGERYDRSALVNDTAGKLYKKTEFGDFIYSSNNLETGSIGLNKYGKASISPVYSIFQSTGLADSDFIGRRFVRKDFINAMVKWRQGVIYGQWRIHESDFIKIEVAVPSVEEQRKIGVFLDNLDNLITLHQRKCDEEKQKKKALMQLLLTGIVRVKV